MADPHPFESDVIRNKITDSVFFVPIEDADSGKVYYGGNQGWYEEYESSIFDLEYFIHNFGCGVIAASDLLVYLACNKEGWNTNFIDIFLGDIENSYINKKSYMLFTE